MSYLYENKIHIDVLNCVGIVQEFYIRYGYDNYEEEFDSCSLNYDFYSKPKDELDNNVLDFLKFKNIININKEAQAFYYLSIIHQLPKSYRYLKNLNASFYQKNKNLVLRELITLVDENIVSKCVLIEYGGDDLKNISSINLKEFLSHLKFFYAGDCFWDLSIQVGRLILSELSSRGDLSSELLKYAIYCLDSKSIHKMISLGDFGSLDKFNLGIAFPIAVDKVEKASDWIKSDLIKFLSVLEKYSHVLKNYVVLSDFSNNQNYLNLCSKFNSSREFREYTFDNLSGYSNQFIDNNKNKYKTYVWSALSNKKDKIKREEVKKYSQWLGSKKRGNGYFPTKMSSIIVTIERVYFYLKNKRCSSYGEALNLEIMQDVIDIYQYFKNCPNTKYNRYLADSFVSAFLALDFASICTQVNDRLYLIFNLFNKKFNHQSPHNSYRYHASYQAKYNHNIYLKRKCFLKIFSYCSPYFINKKIDKEVSFIFNIKQYGKYIDNQWSDFVDAFMKENEGTFVAKRVYQTVASAMLEYSLDKKEGVSYLAREKFDRLAMAGFRYICQDIDISSKNIEGIIIYFNQFVYLKWISYISERQLDDISNNLQSLSKSVSTDFNRQLSFFINLKGWDLVDESSKLQKIHQITKDIFENTKNVNPMRLKLVKDNPRFGHLIKISGSYSLDYLKEYDSLSSYLKESIKSKKLRGNVYRDIFQSNGTVLNTNVLSFVRLLRLYPNTNHQKEFWSHLIEMSSYFLNKAEGFYLTITHSILDVLSLDEIRRLILKEDSPLTFGTALSHLNDIENYNKTIKDCLLNSIQSGIELTPYVRPKRIRRLEELHTEMGAWISYAKNNPDIPLYREQDSILNVDQLGIYPLGLTISVPKKSGELLEFSKQMKNCIGGYVDKILQGWSKVLNIYLDDIPYINIEIVDRRINEIKRKFNERVSENELFYIKDLLVKCDIIDEKESL